MIKKIFRITGFKISVLITLVFLLLFAKNYMYIGSESFIELVDKKLVDFIIRSRGNTLKTDNVVIAAIDTKSIDRYGRWPWGRNLMADLLHELETHYHVRVLGYDVVFAEPDTNDITAERVLDSYYKLISRENRNSRTFQDRLRKIHSKVSSEVKNDAKFGAELSKWDNVVLGYYFFTNANIDQISHISDEQLAEYAGRLENSEITIIEGAEYLPYMQLIEGLAVEANIRRLIARHNLSGFFNYVPDLEDGTIRRVPLVIKYKDMYFPSLDLQIVRRYYGDPSIRMVVNEGGIEGFALGDKWIKTDSDGTVMINYRGEAFTFNHYSVYDIITHKVPVEKIEGRVVLLGATETGVYDLRTTPMGSAFPGVEVHANLIDNLINEDYFHRSDFVHFLTFMLILFVGLIVGIILPRLSALPGLVFSVVSMAAYITINLWFLNNERTWTSFVYVLGVILFNWFAIVLFKFFGEEKDARFIKGAFQQYLSPKVIDQLVDNPDMLKLGGEKRAITAFFSDVQGFSTISESLSPEELVELLNEYLTAMTDIIMKYNGTVDKFEGDAVIAFFGAPVIYKDHAVRACLASLEMQEKLVEMRKVWKKRGKHELYVRIGLNTGQAVVGNMGSAYRMDYTMMGDEVNLAARLEGVNKQYNTFTMISEYTYKEIKDAVEVRELDMIRVVGKVKPVRIFEVLGKKDEVVPEVMNAKKYFAKGLILYRQQKWDEARKFFGHTIKLLKNDGPSKAFYERCKQFKIKPPGENWDGVYTMGSK